MSDRRANFEQHETSPETPLTKSDKEKSLTDLYESPYTIPNALTLARLLACPVLGYMIVQGDYAWATSILFASGVTDWVGTIWVDDVMNLISLGFTSWTVGLRDDTIVSPFWDPF